MCEHMLQFFLYPMCTQLYSFKFHLVAWDIIMEKQTWIWIREWQVANVGFLKVSMQLIYYYREKKIAKKKQHQTLNQTYYAWNNPRKA